MTRPHLAPPPRDVVRREALPPTPPPPRAVPAPEARPRDGYGRALRWALVASILAHAALLLLTGEFTIDPTAPRSRDADRPEPLAGMEWVVPVPEGAEGDSPPAASEVEPVEARPEVIPRVLRVTPGNPDPVPAPPPAAPDAAAGAPGGRASTRDVLRPGYRDPRLYVEKDELGLRREQQSDHERYMEHLSARIEAINDSMGVAAAREKAAKDWTFRDKNGKRWGLSDEGLHLGGITVPPALVPLPRSTGDNATRERWDEEQRQRDEIRRQEATRVPPRDTARSRPGGG